METNKWLMTGVLGALVLCGAMTSCSEDDDYAKTPVINGITFDKKYYQPGDTATATLDIACNGDVYNGAGDNMTWKYSTSTADADVLETSKSYRPTSGVYYKEKTIKFAVPKNRGSYTATFNMRYSYSGRSETGQVYGTINNVKGTYMVE